jgi:peptide/nickel transport system substrate-binding protein
MKIPRPIGTLNIVALCLIMALVTVIVACGGGDAEPTAPTAAPAAEPTAVMEDTDEGPAATPAPTPTPAATTRAPDTRPQLATPTPLPVPTATTEPAPVAAVAAKLQRVRMANTVPLNESNRIWVGPWSNLVQNDPYGETLIENEKLSSEPIPSLATDWEVADDFGTWTFTLQKGVPWHFGFGEFTAADVAHTWELLVRENSNSNFKAIWLAARPEIHDDYSISFHFEKPQLTGGRLFSRLQGDLLIQSKAQWDAAGGAESAYDDLVAGTGSYQFGGRRLGESVWYEKIDGDHWAGENPDFQELEWVWASEQFTRLSQLLAGEVQGADLSREVQVDAKNGGMRVVSSNNENNQSYGFFGGTYLSTVDSDLNPWPDGHPYYTGEEPWHNPVVREAFNLAVDRQAIIDEVYFGNASPVYVPVYAPFTEGWNNRWVDEFDEKYGYNPEKARELLEGQGYADGDISIDLLSTVIPGNPEIPQLIEILSTMWEAIGIDTNIVDMEFGSWLAKVQAHDIHESFTILRNTPIRTTQEGLRIFWASAPDGFLFGWEDDVINEKYDCLERSLNVAEREQCAGDAGDYMFDDFLTLPLFQTTFDMTIDPAFISEWIYPGVGSAHPTHVHNIKACPVGTDRCE